MMSQVQHTRWKRAYKSGEAGGSGASGMPQLSQKALSRRLRSRRQKKERPVLLGVWLRVCLSAGCAHVLPAARTTILTSVCVLSMYSPYHAGQEGGIVVCR